MGIRTRTTNAPRIRRSRGAGSGHAAAAATPAAGPQSPAVKLSIVMPVYNEERTIAAAVSSVLRASYPCDYELIIVDDGSHDSTAEILRALRHPRARVITHERNLGKGGALLTGAQAATGTHLVPFDADLEYDAVDLAALVAPVLAGRTQVVYGARLFGANTRYQSYRHAVGNRAMTLAANVLFDARLSDLHTCLKLVPVELFRELELRESGFGLDTEITAKLLSNGIRPFEVPVSYHSRSAAHGKKITWRDGVQCLHVLARVRSTRGPSQSTAAARPLDTLASATTIMSELASSPVAHRGQADGARPVSDGVQAPQ